MVLEYELHEQSRIHAFRQKRLSEECQHQSLKLMVLMVRMKLLPQKRELHALLGCELC
jgi:hypothetical protein